MIVKPTSHHVGQMRIKTQHMIKKPTLHSCWNCSLYTVHIIMEQPQIAPGMKSVKQVYNWAHEDTIIIRRLQIICLCVFTKIIIIFAPITCGRSGLINQVRERNIKNIENQMQFNIQFNPVSIMLLYYDCSNWNGLSMYPRMLEDAGKRTLGWQNSS